MSTGAKAGATVVSVEVDRPAEEVFAYATDPTKFSQWQAGVVSGTMETKGTTRALGDHCHTTRRMGGSELPSTSELVRFEPPRSWSVHGIDGPIRAQVDVDVEPLSPDRARISIAVDFEGHGIGKLLVPLVVRRQARAEMPRNIAMLKECVES
jgi:carbon monoxide dehydrogenase subunit G